MSEPARKEVANLPVEGQVIPADATNLMAVISRAAADPNTDVDKLERLLGMYERITAQQAQTLYSEAMNAAQEEMGPVRADANNPQTKSKYASYAALDRAIRPIYTKHGFSLSFDSADCPLADHVRVVCKVSHSGHSESPHLDMPADGKGAKGGDVMTKTHAIGAAVTYGKRYLLGMVFNIVVGEDDDGNSNGGRNDPGSWITAKQVETLAGLIEEAGADRDKFLNFLRIDTLAHLPAKRFGEVINLLAQKKAQAAKPAASSDFPGDR